MKARSFLVAICLAVAGMLSAATLDVELEVAHGAYSDAGLVASRKVVYLVVDRSASMSDKSLKGGRTPDEALFESLSLQLASIPSGTEVHILPFSNKVWDEVVFKRLDDAARKSIVKLIKGMKPRGQTVLYDAQDMALSAAAKILASDANADVRVLVYTDGLHLTPWDYKGEYKACLQLRTAKKRFVNNPNYETERMAAKKKFENRFHDLFAKPNLEVEYEWLSSTPKPQIEMRTKPSINTELIAHSASLQNPRTAPRQVVKCKLLLPVTDGCWKEVKGKPLTLDFEVEGKHASTMLNLEEGKTVCKLDWPSLPDDKPAIARLSFLRMPGGKKFDLKSPKPVEMSVPAQGKVSVSIVGPAKGALFPVGANVGFVARVSEGADAKWSVGKGEILKGVSANWAAKAPGRVNYSVTASRAGLKDATAAGFIEIIPAGVEIVAGTDRYEVGKDSVFQAKAVGPCQRYTWTVDGKRVPGETATLKYVFESSGPHKVGVTATYKGGFAKDAERGVTVSAAPFIEVLLPMAYDGDAENVLYQAEKPIDLSARVEGDLTAVEWRFKLKDKTETVTTSVKDGKTSGRYTPPKGGFYDVEAAAKGPAGEKSVTVQVFVKSTDVSVDIETPKPNQEVETGKEFDLSAVTKGPVKGVRWTILNKSTAQTVKFGQSDVSPVVDGKASIKAKLPLEVGNASLTVSAEPVLEDKDLADTVEASTVTVNAFTPAAICYTQETLANNWKRVKYRSQMTLGVTTTGAIKKVAWLTFDADGKEMELGKDGTSVNVDIPVVQGQGEHHVDYLAKGLLPDGSWVPADQRITIVACCPCGLVEEGDLPRIKLPEKDGITRTSFGLKDAVQAEIKCTNGCEVADVEWDMGDGTRYKGLVVNHPNYNSYGRYIIAAQAKCKVCGRDFSIDPVEIVVEKQIPKAVLEILNQGSHYGIGDKITLSAAKSTGDIVDYVWELDGQEIADGRGKKEVVVKLPGRPCEMVARLKLLGLEGAEAISEPRVIRVRYGAVGVVILILLVLLAIGVLAKLLLKNGPAGWKAKVYCCEEINLATDDGRRKEQRKCDNGDNVRIGKYWSLWDKRATIPLARLAKQYPRIEKFFRLCNVGATITVTEDDVGRPNISHQALALNSQVKVLNGNAYRQYRAARPWPKGKEPKFLRFVVVETSPAHFYLILFFILVLCVIYAAFLVALRYAI